MDEPSTTEQQQSNQAITIFSNVFSGLYAISSAVFLMACTYKIISGQGDTNNQTTNITEIPPPQLNNTRTNPILAENATSYQEQKVNSETLTLTTGTTIIFCVYIFFNILVLDFLRYNKFIKKLIYSTTELTDNNFNNAFATRIYTRLKPISTFAYYLILTIKSGIYCYSFYQKLERYLTIAQFTSITLAVMLFPLSLTATWATYIPVRTHTEENDAHESNKYIEYLLRFIALGFSTTATSIYSSTMEEKISIKIIAPFSLFFFSSLYISMSKKIASLWNQQIPKPKTVAGHYFEKTCHTISTVFYCVSTWLAAEFILETWFNMTETGGKISILIPLLVANIFASQGYLTFEGGGPAYIVPIEDDPSSGATPAPEDQTLELSPNTTNRPPTQRL